MKMEFVTKEIKNHIAYITLNRPPVNALNYQVYTELKNAFSSIYQDLDDVYVVIFTAKGNHFIAGNDIHGFQNVSKLDIIEQAFHFRNCMTSIANCPVPVIGAINGTAAGAGFCAASLCDVLVAAEGSRFGLPEIKIGVIGALSFVSRMVPEKLGKYMTLTGNFVPAEKLQAYGSIHSIVPRDELIPEAEKIAKEIMMSSPLNLQTWKRAYQEIYPLNFSNNEHSTDRFIMDLMATEDFKEALNAFFEKRPPEYKGK